MVSFGVSSFSRLLEIKQPKHPERPSLGGGGTRGEGLLGPAWYNIHLHYGSLNMIIETDDLMGLYTE